MPKHYLNGTNFTLVLIQGGGVVSSGLIYMFTSVIWKMREKIFLNPQTFFCFCFILYKEKMLTDKATIKSLKIEDGREAP